MHGRPPTKNQATPFECGSSYFTISAIELGHFFASSRSSDRSAGPLGHSYREARTQRVFSSPRAGAKCSL
jgi:hypothetical protein